MTLTINHPEIKDEVERYVKEFMSKFDPSHDYHHVDRVRNLSLKLANSIVKSDSIKNIDFEIVELVALLHDVKDAKYVKPEDSINIQNLLASFGYPDQKSELVAKLVNLVGYRKEVEYIESKKYDELRETNLELWCVQDADKLDAIGCIGVLRCAAFSGIKNNLLIDRYFDVERRDDKLGKTAVGHMEEKLVKLKEMIKTKLGKQLAEKRHEALLRFLNDIYMEFEDCE